MNIYKYFDGTTIHVSDDTVKNFPNTFMKNGLLWENKSIEIFYKKYVTKSNPVIVDIGAQVGLYTLYAKNKPDAIFHAFEPYKKAFDCLNDNIKLNDITNIKTYNYAISDKNEKSYLSCSNKNYGLNTLSQSPLRFQKEFSTEVQTITLDSFIDFPVDYIKIDTEGWEYFILEGGYNTIQKYKPVIQLEWNLTNMQQCNVTPTMMNNLINKLKYTKTEITNEELIISPI